MFAQQRWSVPPQASHIVAAFMPGLLQMLPGLQVLFGTQQGCPGPPQADTQLSAPAVLPQNRPVWQRAWPPAVGQQFWFAPPQAWQTFMAQVLPGSHAFPPPPPPPPPVQQG